MADASQYPDSGAQINTEKRAILSGADAMRCRAIRLGATDLVMSIVEEVAAQTGVPIRDILGRCRRADEARQLVMFVARRTGLSYPKIGHAMNRDHTTIIAGVKREKARRAVQG